MRAPLTVRREPAGGPEQAGKFVIYMFMNLKRKKKYSNPCSTYPYRGILTYQ